MFINHRMSLQSVIIMWTKKNAPSAGIFQLIPCTTPSSSPLIHISSAWTLWIRRVYSKNVSISFMLIRQGKIENTAGNSLSCVCDDNDNDDDSEHKNKKRISSKCLWCKKRWRWQKKAREREREGGRRTWYCYTIFESIHFQ